MCHNSDFKSAQIDRFIEQGMPQKIVKSVKNTIKKRVKVHRKTCVGYSSAQTLEGMHNCTCINNTEIMEAVPIISPKSPKVCPMLAQNSEATKPIVVSSAAQQAEDANNVIHVDALASSTMWTKKQAERLSRVVENLQSSTIYILLTKTTQPAHVIAICIFGFVFLTVWPKIIEKTSSETTLKTEENNSNHLAIIAYLGAFATHFGAQIWMTFVSGLSLYFALPRHTFGQCQQILFPKYFALNSVLSISMLILFVKFFLKSLSFSGCIQLASLILTALIEVTVRLYLAPPMLRLMHAKYKIEDAVGSGKEVGGLVQGDLVQCPHYQHIHKMFRRIHMTIAIGNIVVLLCTCIHLHYLASKISLK